MNKREITAVIIDDEESSRNVLRILLDKYCPEVKLIGECGDLEDAYSTLNRLKPQLVFLDIRMSGSDTFKLLGRFDQIDFRIIFVTSFNEYAIKAIKYSALDYLLKPIEIEDLKLAVSKAVTQIAEHRNTTVEVIHLVQNMEESDENKTIVVHDKGNVNYVRLTEIMYIQSDMNYSVIHLNSNTKLMASKPLKYFEELLSTTKLFIRAHKSYLVNHNFIAGYTKKEPHFLLLKNGLEIEISRRKKHEVNTRLAGKEL